ncbi:hypothetical protein OG730_42740 (plasmid) [Streptomyces sp. NBC_01298]|uniref:hypothetical protein n=1 Tax=Streptomyces sp. NBC_01298 TaxID=2903817 RepID=UPI002E1221CE|nr:hypothetical protein OG730_42740 [Streptomyces sp. NBC_01298]
MPRERFTPFDFGLPRLAGDFHQDWGYVGEAGDVALESFGDSAGAAALEYDVSLLIVSALSDSQIELLWGAATAENYRFEPNESGRDLLRRFQMVARDWQRAHGSIRPEGADPEWGSPELRERVLRAVGAAPLSMGLREVLDVCARTVSVELAFRLLLRLYAAGSHPVAPAVWTEYQEINTAFALGEYVVGAIEYLVEEKHQ